MGKRKYSVDPWTKEEVNRLIKLKKSNKYTNEDIAEILINEGFPMRSSEAIRKAWKRHYDPFIAAREKIVLKKLDNIKKKNIKNSRSKIGFTKNPKKILVLGDLHAPFENMNVIDHAIKYHSDADVVVLNGDIFEVYSVSKWPKNKQLLLKEEYKIGFNIIKRFAENFNKVILTKGNHEERLDKYFSSNIERNVSFLADSDILERVAKGYYFDEDDNFVQMYNMDNVIYAKGQTSWYTQIGKCIIAHPTGTTGEGGKCVLSAVKYFDARDINFQCLVAGHAHCVTSMIRNGKLLIEHGCACAPMEYEGNSKVNYRPQSSGYAIVYMDKEGNVDFNKTKNIYLGVSTVVEDKMIKLRELIKGE